MKFAQKYIFSMSNFFRALSAESAAVPMALPVPVGSTAKHPSTSDLRSTKSILPEMALSDFVSLHDDTELTTTNGGLLEML